MALKNLNKNIARAKAAKKPKPLPRLDPAPALLAEAVDKQTEQGKKTVTVLQKLVDKEVSFELDAAEIGTAIGKEIRKMPVPGLKIPERIPLSYEATVTQRDRQGNLVKAKIEPILE